MISMIDAYDQNNNVIKCEMLFTFEKNNKKFYLPGVWGGYKKQKMKLRLEIERV